MLLGDSGWVEHREHGVVYQFDITKSMFSSGNGTEKDRIGKLCAASAVARLQACSSPSLPLPSLPSSLSSSMAVQAAPLWHHGDVVVDLYAGIGYFTLPMLLHGMARRVIACELNPYSVTALQRSLASNIGDDARKSCFHCAWGVFESIYNFTLLT